MVECVRKRILVKEKYSSSTSASAERLPNSSHYRKTSAANIESDEEHSQVYSVLGTPFLVPLSWSRAAKCRHCSRSRQQRKAKTVRLSEKRWSVLQHNINFLMRVVPKCTGSLVQPGSGAVLEARRPSFCIDLSGDECCTHVE